MSTKVKVIARMTVTKTDGKKLIVEVHADATEHAFYHWYSQDGRKRKVFFRTSHRTDGAERVAQVLRSTPGLELLAERMKGNAYMQVKDIKIRILLKRAYKRMTTCSADQLGTLPKCGPSEYQTGECPAKPLYPVTRFVVHTREYERRKIGLGAR